MGNYSRRDLEWNQIFQFPFRYAFNHISRHREFSVYVEYSLHLNLFHLLVADYVVKAFYFIFFEILLENLFCERAVRKNYLFLQESLCFCSNCTSAEEIPL